MLNNTQYYSNYAMTLYWIDLSNYLLGKLQIIHKCELMFRVSILLFDRLTENASFFITPNLSGKKQPGQAILTLPIPFAFTFCTTVCFYEYEEGLD